MLTVSDRDKPGAVEVARQFLDIGFRLRTTNGTGNFLAEHGIDTDKVMKVTDGRPHLVDAMKNGEIQLVINTPNGKAGTQDDSYIRKEAIKYKIPYITTLAAAQAAGRGIAARRGGMQVVKSLQEYHADIGG